MEFGGDRIVSAARAELGEAPKIGVPRALLDSAASSIDAVVSDGDVDQCLITRDAAGVEVKGRMTGVTLRAEDDVDGVRCLLERTWRVSGLDVLSFPVRAEERRLVESLRLAICQAVGVTDKSVRLKQQVCVLPWMQLLSVQPGPGVIDSRVQAEVHHAWLTKSEATRLLAAYQADVGLPASAGDSGHGASALIQRASEQLLTTERGRQISASVLREIAEALGATFASNAQGMTLVRGAGKLAFTTFGCWYLPKCRVAVGGQQLEICWTIVGEHLGEIGEASQSLRDDVNRALGARYQFPTPRVELPERLYYFKPPPWVRLCRHPLTDETLWHRNPSRLEGVWLTAHEALVEVNSRRLAFVEPLG